MHIGRHHKGRHTAAHAAAHAALKSTTVRVRGSRFIGSGSNVVNVTKVINVVKGL